MNDKTVVWGYGKLPAPIMLVGEAPGEEELKQGIPFVGPAGQLLREHLLTKEIEEQSWVTNAVKILPEDRTPSKEDIRRWRPILLGELVVAQPSVVVCVGRVAFEGIYGTSLDSVVSKSGKKVGTIGNGNGIIDVYLTIHPAAALRNGDYMDLFISSSNEIRKKIIRRYL
jgi:DNA polymerase